jgi:hypothetical protein
LDQARETQHDDDDGFAHHVHSFLMRRFFQWHTPDLPQPTRRRTPRVRRGWERERSGRCKASGCSGLLGRNASTTPHEYTHYCQPDIKRQNKSAI